MHAPRLLLALSLTYRYAVTEQATATPRPRLHWVVTLLAVGVALDLLIGTTLGYVAVQARSAASQAHIVKVAAYESCLATNDRNAADLARWGKVLALVDTGPATPQRKSFLAGVRAANQVADAPRDCGRLVP